MKLYYAPGACSLSPHIVSREAGLALTLDKVDFATKKTESGKDYLKLNPKGAVPALELDDGTILTEGPAIVQYLADQKPGSGLLPATGQPARYRVIEWLGFINSEVHKQFTPLFKGASEELQKTARANILDRLAFIDKHLADKSYVAGDSFSVADAYTFVVLNWANFLKMDLKPYPNIQAYVGRIAGRPKVQEALKAEGLA